MITTATTPAEVPVPRPLTPRQRAVLRAVARHIRDTGQAPTIRELRAALGIASNNGVVCHLKALVKKGWVTYEFVGRGRGVARARRLSIPAVTAATKQAAARFLKFIREK